MQYLTHQSTLQCVHGGKVVFSNPAQKAFTINGSPALVEEDVTSASIVGCAQVGPGLKPCMKARTILSGRAAGICADGRTPLLITLQAMTDGNPPGLVCVMSDGGSVARTLFPAPPAPEDRADPADDHKSDPEKRSFIHIRLIRPDGSRAVGERYRIVTPDGKHADGFLDADGEARVSGIDAGRCEVIFPDMEAPPRAGEA